VSLTASQQAIRKSGVTAGDMRALCGKDPYGRTAHDVFLHKCGLEPEIDLETEAMRLGHQLEPLIVRETAKKSETKIVRVKRSALTIRHKKFRHHVATPDAWVAAEESEVALIEAKLVGYFSRFDWGKEADEIPDGFRIQVGWQMHVADVSRTYLGALMGSEIRVYPIDRDLDLEGSLVEICDRFHRDHVLTRKPPKVDGSPGSERMLRALYPQSSGLTLKASATANAWAFRFFEAERLLKNHEADREKAKQALMALCGNAGRMVGDGWTLNYPHHNSYPVARRSYVVKPGRRFKLK
jgi:predicted phage-related endonuclease